MPDPVEQVVEAPIAPAPSKRPVSNLPETIHPIEGAEDKGWDAMMAKLGKDLKVKMFDKDAPKPAELEKAKEEKKEEKKDPAPAPAPEKKDEQPAPAPVAKKETPVKKKAPVPAPQPVDTAKIAADAAAKATAAAMSEIEKNKPKAEPVADIVVSEEDKPVIEVLEFMAKKDKANEVVLRKYNEFLKKEHEYRSTWEKENPGKEFQPDAEDHVAFYDANSVPLNERAFHRAEQQMIAERATEEATKKVKAEYDGKLTALERERILERIQPEINHRGAQINKEIATALGDEVAKALESSEGFKKLQDEDPIAAEAFENAHRHIAPVVEAVITIYKSRGLVAMDPKNPAHVEMAKLSVTLEENVAKQSLEDQTNEKGQRFATVDDYVKMTPEQQAKHWIIGPDELLLALQETGKLVAKGHQERRKAEIAKYLPKGTPQNPNPAPEKKVDPKPEPQKEKPVPSIASGAKIGASNGDPTPAPKDFLAGIGKGMFGRS